MPLLSPADRFPSADGLLGASNPGSRHRDDPAQQTGIGGRDPVVPVQVQLGQAGNINTLASDLPEYPAAARVQSVDAFQDNQLIFSQLDDLARFAFAQPEIVLGELNFFARQSGGSGRRPAEQGIKRLQAS